MKVGNAKASNRRTSNNHRSCAFCVGMLTNKTMANWQDIRALEERIYDVVDEYLANSEAYKNAGLHVWLDEDDMIYRAEVDDNLAGSEDDGVYAIAGVVRQGDEGLEPDVDRISDIANSWIFLD